MLECSEPQAGPSWEAPLPFTMSKTPSNRVGLTPTLPSDSQLIPPKVAFPLKCFLRDFILLLNHFLSKLYASLFSRLVLFFFVVLLSRLVDHIA